jgi:hypothetical protein
MKTLPAGNKGRFESGGTPDRGVKQEKTSKNTIKQE